MIAKTIKTIYKKNTLQGLEGLLTAKISEKKILYKVLEGILTAKIPNNFFFFLYFLYIKGLNVKMAAITNETYENSSIEVITDNFNKLWLNERHVEKQLGLTDLPALTNKYIKKYNGYKEYKKQRSELNESTNQPNKRFIHADLALKIIVEQMNRVILKVT